MRTLPWAKRSGGVPLSEVRGWLDAPGPAAGGNIRHYDLALHYLLSRHPPRGGAPRLLELGCGGGFFLDFLAGHGYEKAVGLDMDEERVRAARSRGLDARVAKASGFRARGFAAAFAVRFFSVELKFLGRERRRADILAAFAGVRAALVPGGSFYCDSEVPLPVAAIEALGFRVRHRLLRAKLHPMLKARARDDVWVFERKGRTRVSA